MHLASCKIARLAPELWDFYPLRAKTLACRVDASLWQTPSRLIQSFFTRCCVYLFNQKNWDVPLGSIRFRLMRKWFLINSELLLMRALSHPQPVCSRQISRLHQHIRNEWCLVDCSQEILTHPCCGERCISLFLAQQGGWGGGLLTQGMTWVWCNTCNNPNSFMVSVFRHACGCKHFTKVIVSKCDDFTCGWGVSACVCAVALLVAERLLKHLPAEWPKAAERIRSSSF